VCQEARFASRAADCRRERFPRPKSPIPPTPLPPFPRSGGLGFFLCFTNRNNAFFSCKYFAFDAY
jgi:hypothetical protein